MLKQVMTKLFAASGDSGAPVATQRPKARLGCERFEDRVNPAGWLDDYANWFNRQVGDGYSDAVGGAIHSGLDAVGFSDGDLAAKDDMQLLMGTTVIAVPLGIGLFAGGEVVFGVGTFGGAAAVTAVAVDGIGTTAVVAPGLGAGIYPALLINGTVYVGRMHIVANQLAIAAGVNAPAQIYGIVTISASGQVLGWLYR